MNKDQENTAVQVFSNPTIGEIRVLELDGEPWFVGTDVARALGYSNPRKALIDCVADEDKRVTRFDTEDGTLETTSVNALGVHALIAADSDPKMAEFKPWFWTKVLPAARRRIDQKGLAQMLSSPDTLIQLLSELKKANEKANAARERTVAEQHAAEEKQAREMGLDAAIKAQIAAERSPIHTYYDDILSCKEPVSSSQIARDYGWSLGKLNKVLAEKSVQTKQGRIWVLNPEYAGWGYTKTISSVITGQEGKPYTKASTEWTQTGRLFLYHLLKSDGILPMVERGIAND